MRPSLKGEVGELILEDPQNRERFHYFHWANGVPINASHKDVLVNLLEYWQVTGDEKIRFCWVTDIPFTKENVYRIMRAGRARWKIENETFNTLKNQGYNFEHNYGLGKQYLSMVFVKIMMLAFLVDQDPAALLRPVSVRSEKSGIQESSLGTDALPLSLLQAGIHGDALSRYPSRLRTSRACHHTGHILMEYQVRTTSPIYPPSHGLQPRGKGISCHFLGIGKGFRPHSGCRSVSS